MEKNKILEINLTKEVKELYTDNYLLLKKVQMNQKTSQVHGLETLILLKCSYYPKQF